MKITKNGFKIIFIMLLFSVISSLYAEPKGLLKSFTYILQADKFADSRSDAVKELASSDRDLFIIDYSFSGSDNDKWWKSELDKIRAGKKGRKIVSYISIGEAEDYRYYWKEDKIPSYICKMNPEWKGNYKVRYWEKEWQNLILEYISTIIKQGFDGIYLDIIDAYQYYEYDSTEKEWIDNRKNPDTGNSYRQDMINWVGRISEYSKKIKPGFMIIPQNGSGLLNYHEYIKHIDGIGIEDLYTDGNKKQEKEHTKSVLKDLEFMTQNDKPVFIVEYATRKKLINKIKEISLSANFRMLFTKRDLTVLGKH
jgi:cysteinyl-tRNA synthetase